jgi:alpha-amylase/alpha-mannosidase (GH57 family)
MAEVAVAFLWHQHQPYYFDDVAGDCPLPWARLRGARDCYGMARLLDERPEMRCAVNLTPCLLAQVRAYSERHASDRFLDASRLPADALTEADALFLLDHFFLASPEQQILPSPRYAELFRLRASGERSAREALRRFSRRDLRDLQVWFNLAWSHPLALEQDDVLRDLRARGADFTEDDKDALLDRHLDLLAQVVPLHRRLADAGQIELTTSPFHHPILPLLLDRGAAREAQPDVRLPRAGGGYSEDAAAHLRKALAEHQRAFGRAPVGLWPPEGAVSQAMLPLLAEHGFRWLATDEGLLSATTGGAVGRDDRGHVRDPARLYRPYRVADGLAILFRDHALSDRIALSCPAAGPGAAADDFVAQLRAIGGAVPGPGPVLVTVVLDGETCWERSADGGVAFLRALYQRCTTTPGLRTVTPGDFLERHPPAETLPRLAAGSCIDRGFAAWIGGNEVNAAWDALDEARRHLLTREQRWRGDLTPGPTGSLPDHLRRRLERAWEEVHVAEGSDWFWWFGDSRAGCPEDALFDRLFRKHLQNVYLVLGDVPPPTLALPLRERGAGPVCSAPRALLDVKIDGRAGFFEWVGAGRYACPEPRGTLREVFFGFDLNRLLVRIDCAGPARQALATADALRLIFTDPPGVEACLEAPARDGTSARLLRPGAAPVPVEAGVEAIAELAVPFDALGVPVGGAVRFAVVVGHDGRTVERAPREGVFSLTRPSADFERIMWAVLFGAELGGAADLRPDRSAAPPRSTTGPGPWTRRCWASPRTSEDCRCRNCARTRSSVAGSSSPRSGPSGRWRPRPSRCPAAAACARFARATRSTRPTRSSPIGSAAPGPTSPAGASASCPTSSPPCRSRATSTSAATAFTTR